MTESLLIVDTDALIQALKVKRTHLFEKLRSLHGLSTFVMPEVEAEVRSPGYRGPGSEQDFENALQAKHLRVLDSAAIRNLLARNALSQSVGTRIQSTGATFSRIVDRGEAFTHAAAVELAVPAMSHDKKAVQALLRKGHPVGIPTLRFMDLVVFAWNEGWLTEADGDGVRDLLKKNDEWIPVEFGNHSFSVAAATFSCRMKRNIGTVAPTPTKFNDVLFV